VDDIKYKIVLPKQHLNNLKIFLSRANLTGQEVPAFNEILKAIYTAELIEGEKSKKAGE
jgi:hypothetical protein